MPYQESRETVALGCFSLFLLLVLSIPLNAFTLVCFWRWYIVPVTHFEPLQLWQAFGLSLIVALFSSPDRNNETKRERTAGQTVSDAVIHIAVRYGFLWAMAGILHWLAR